MKKLSCIKKGIIFAGICLVGFMGCKKEEFKKLEKEEKNEVIERILSLGFDINDVVEYDDYYIAEGDITFLKHEPEPIFDSASTLKQSRTNNLAVNGTIRVYLNQNFPTLNSQISNALNQALSAYNNLNSSIQFQRVTSPTNAHITIYCDNNIGSNVCGIAGFPLSDGRPFPTVRISETTLINSGLTNNRQLVFLLAHELGHNIGLRHTNWSQRGETANPEGAIIIPNTPTTDNASVMNAATCGFWWNGFSNFDIVAITNLYPNFRWASTSTAGSGASSNSDLTSCSNGKVFYIGTDGIIRATFRSGSSWSNMWFPNFPKAKTSSGLYWNTTNTELFYIATNNTICRIYWTGSSWQYQYTAGSGASSNSDLTSCSNGKVFYIGTDGIIRATFRSGSSWSNMWFPNFPKAKTGSGLYWNTTNAELFYVATNNTICRIYWSGSSWQYQYTAGSGACSNSDLTSCSNGKVFYRGTDGTICYTVRSGNSWTKAQFSSSFPKAKTGSSLYWNSTNAELYYIDLDDKINRIFWNGSSWSHTVISRTTYERGSLKLCYDNNRLSYIYGSSIRQIEIYR